MNKRAWSKTDLVAVTNLSDRLLTDVLAGRKPLPPSAIKPLCIAFEVNPEDLT